MPDATAFILPTPSSPLTTFHCFNNLPLELRRHIWRLCLPGPRIHRIGWTSRDKATRSSCISPDIMLGCREARTEALHHLKRLNLPSNFSEGYHSTPKGCTSRCYFNPRIDTLFLTSPSQPSFSPGLQGWLQGWLQTRSLDSDEGTDFTLIRHLAIDRSWLEGVRLPVIQVEEVVRYMGHVEVLHVVSLNSFWSLRPWTQWREVRSSDSTRRAEFSWVDMEEVKKRPARGYTRIWAEWGENSLMANANSDDLSLDASDAIARYQDTMQRLERERMRHPTGWKVSKVQLDFVRYDRVERAVREVAQPKGLLRLGPSIQSTNRALKEWFGLG